MAIPITLLRAQRVEALIDALAHDLSGRKTSVLQEQRLLLPSPGLDTVVRRALARRDGIAANLSTSYPQAFVAETLERSLPGVELLDRQHVLCALVALVHDDARLAAPELAPVRRYLDTAGDDTDARDRRRVQLAAELDQLYDEYMFTRPDMMRAWSDGADATPAPGDGAWQRCLWRMVLERTAPRTPVPVAAAMLAEPVTGLTSPNLHVLGFSTLPPLVLQLLRHVAATSTVRVYALAPTALEAGPPWGETAEEGVALMAAALGVERAEVVAPPALPDTLLGALQRELGGGSSDRKPPLAGDSTVLVLSAPSPAREMEAIAAEIWNLLRGDASLRMSDIAVVLPSAARDTLLPELESVFAAGGLPWRVVDRSLRAPATALQAADLLLDLPLGGLTRPDVLRLVSHPAVLARLPGVAPERWFDLCDRLGVIRGATAEDDATYLEHDVLSWEQGLRRLALGALLARPGGGERAEPYALGGAPLLPADLSPDERSDALTFALLVRSLLADARAAVAEAAPLGRHLAFMRAFLSAYLAPAGDADDLALQAAHRALVRLEDAVNATGGSGPVSYRIACELARRALQGVETARSGHSDGVVISSFLATRGVPFRVRFLCGLDEGVFPAGRPPRTLDVRSDAPRPGDLDARAQDELLFLDALLSTRERVVLSYRGRDQLTGDLREPSPVLGEILDLLRDDERVGADPPRRRIPLHRFEDESSIAESAAAAAEARARYLGQVPQLEVPVTIPGIAAAGGRPPTITISISALKAFLLCPPQGWARALLRMSSDVEIDDVLARDEEPLSSGSLVGWQLRREAWLAAAARAGRPCPDGQLLATSYDELVALERLAGRAPGGAFGDAERRSDLELMEGWTELLRKLPRLSTVPGAVAFGRGEPGSAQRVVPALALDVHVPSAGGLAVVELFGRSGIVQLGDWSATLELASKKRPELDRPRLHTFIDAVLLSAAGVSSGGEHRLVYCGRGKRCLVEVWPGMPQAQARSYLTSLLEEMLSPVPPKFLPLRAAMLLHEDPERPIVDIVAELAEKDRGMGGNGPLPAPEAFGLPDDDEARAIVARRLTPFFAATGEDTE